MQVSQPHIKENAYKALIRPQVEYAATVWDPYTKVNQDKLELVQRHAAWYVCNNYSREASVTSMIDGLGWCSLQQWRADITLVMFYKIVHGLVAVDFSDSLTPVTRFTRHFHPMAFLLPSESKLDIQQSFVPRTVCQWSNLPAEVATAPSLNHLGLESVHSLINLPWHSLLLLSFLH